jgi:bile acid:Na+ symporter, BASS family
LSGFLASVTRGAMLVFLIASMLELGLRLTLGEIWKPLRNARLIMGSLLANLLLGPLFAFTTARVFRLEEPFAIGLLLLGLSPGAPFIPKLVQLAKGNLPFSVGLMLMLLVGTVFDLPLVLPRLILGVTVDAWQIEKSLLLLMVLPLFVGLVIHGRIRSLPGWLCRFLGAVANVSGLVVLVLILALNLKSVAGVFGTGAILAGLLFVTLLAVAGWLLGGPDRPTRVALGLGTASRNVAAALLVGAQNFKDPKVNVMVIVTALASLSVLLPAANWLGRRAHATTD